MFSKANTALKTLNLIKSIKTNQLQSLRRGHDCNYRAPAPTPPQYISYIASGVQGFAWWWVLWHLYTEPGHVFGEFEYPNPREWSDEELGIPPVE